MPELRVGAASHVGCDSGLVGSSIPNWFRILAIRFPGRGRRHTRVRRNRVKTLIESAVATSPRAIDHQPQTAPPAEASKECGKQAAPRRSFGFISRHVNAFNQPNRSAGLNLTKAAPDAQAGAEACLRTVPGRRFNPAMRRGHNASPPQPSRRMCACPAGPHA